MKQIKRNGIDMRMITKARLQLDKLGDELSDREANIEFGFFPDGDLVFLDIDNNVYVIEKDELILVLKAIV